MTSVVTATPTASTLHNSGTRSNRIRTLSPKIVNMELKAQEDEHKEGLEAIHKEECEQTQVTSPTTVEDEDYELQSNSSLRFSARGAKDLMCDSSTDSHENLDETAEKDDDDDDNSVEEDLAALDLLDHATLKTHGSTPPVIKPYDLANVPVKDKRNSWLTLKPPTGEALRRLSRSQSVPTEALPSARDRRVKFLAVHIREYSQTIGDNPSVSYGPPISLDWDYSSMDPVPLNDYEANRGKRRNLRQMMLNYYHRTHLLQHIVGASEADIHAAQKAAEKIKGQRAMTKALLGMSKMEEAWQAAKRKMGKKRQDKQ